MGKDAQDLSGPCSNPPCGPLLRQVTSPPSAPSSLPVYRDAGHQHRVLQQLQELIGIFCTHLERSDGLPASAYTPARANHTWQRVPHAAINYGRWTPPHTSELSA